MPFIDSLGGPFLIQKYILARPSSPKIASHGSRLFPLGNWQSLTTTSLTTATPRYRAISCPREFTVHILRQEEPAGIQNYPRKNLLGQLTLAQKP